jgi:hypothetical protein
MVSRVPLGLCGARQQQKSNAKKCRDGREWMTTKVKTAHARDQTFLQMMCDIRASEQGPFWGT